MGSKRDELLEALIGSQSIKHRLDPDQYQAGVARFVCLVQVLDRLVILFQARIDNRKVQRRDVARFSASS